MPVTPKTSVSLLDMLRPKDERASSPVKGSRGSPGEFDGLLERIRKADGTRPAERPDAAKASESPPEGEPVAPAIPVSASPESDAAPRVELASASTSGTPAETPTDAAVSETTTTPPATASLPSNAAPNAKAALADAEAIPTTDVASMTPDEVAAVLKERDALAAILAKTPAVSEGTPTVAVAADGEAAAQPTATLPTLPTELVAASVTGAAATVPLTPLTVDAEAVPPSAETPVVVATEPSSPPLDAFALLTSPAPLVGKDYPAVSNGEERISTTALLQALEATVLGDESSDDAPITWRSGVLSASEGMPRTGVASAEPRVDGSVLQTLGVKALLDGNPADTRLAAMTTASLARPSNGSATAKAIAGTIPVLAHASPEGAPSREATPAQAVSRVVGAARLNDSPLERAQQAIQRRAARAAFFEPNAPSPSVGMPAAPRWAAHLDGEPLVREMARSLERPVESLVRAERARTRLRSSDSSESGAAVSEWSSPEHTSRVASQSATPPVTATQPAMTTASVAATPQAHAAVMEQVAQEARRNVRLGRREFRIQLNPENLGSVELEVVWDHDVVKVKIAAASKESQKILEENIGELERALQRQGLGFDTDLPWKAAGSSDALARTPMDLRSSRWMPAWRPGLTVSR